jgi:hypothetical protein
MRDPTTYRYRRRSRAKANLIWQRALAKLKGDPKPTCRTIWPNYHLAAPTHRLPRKQRRGV